MLHRNGATAASGQATNADFHRPVAVVIIALLLLLLVFCKFFVVITVVTGFIADVPGPGMMQRPRSPCAAACSRADYL